MTVVQIREYPCSTVMQWGHDVQTSTNRARSHCYKTKSEWESQCSSPSEGHPFRAGQRAWARSRGGDFRGDRKKRLSSIHPARWVPVESHSNAFIKDTYLRIESKQRDWKGLETVAPLRTWSSHWIQLLRMSTVPTRLSYMNNLLWRRWLSVFKKSFVLELKIGKVYVLCCFPQYSEKPI